MSKFEMAEGYLLGVDLGTTSIKVVLVDAKSKDIVVASASEETKADINGCEGRSEQDVELIFKAVHLAIDKLPKDVLGKVKFIGVSGQMHGVVLWKKNAWNWNPSDAAFNIAPGAVSNLITWQDQRCSPNFLSSLPASDTYDLHSGFGIATLMWLKEEFSDASFLEKFDRAGTIHDMFVDILRDNLDEPILTSDQNAHSWGYFDVQKRDWDLELLESSRFPVRLLPKVKPAGTLAGNLKHHWLGVPADCPVGVALGDCQASVISILQQHTSGGAAAILNISTSIQLNVVTNDCDNRYNMPSGSGSEGQGKYRPYFPEQRLIVAAGLNGGNCLMSFVKIIESWFEAVGVTVPEGKIWEAFVGCGLNQQETSLKIEPTILGERHAPTKAANVSNIKTDNLTLGHFSRALCSGIVENILTMMPVSVLKKLGVTNVYATGSVITRNKVVREEVLRQFSDFSVIFCNAGDSAHGAAIACSF